MTDDRIRVLVLGGVWPHVRESTEAANVVTHEIVSHLAALPNLAVAFARVAQDDGPPPPAAAEALRELEARGASILSGIQRLDWGPRSVGRTVRRYLFASPDAVLRGGASGREMLELCTAWRADCALTIWCEPATAALYDVPVGRMAYYGNPDHKTDKAKADFTWTFRPSRLDPRLILEHLQVHLMLMATKRAHLKVVRRFDVVAEVAANDTAFYQRHGVRATYMRNMWPRPISTNWGAVRDATEQSTPLKIVGNVGSLTATGNRFGLHTLSTSVLPALERTLGRGNFEVHVFGRGTLHPYLTALGDNPHIRLRGFVDDIDAEILSSPVFLVANNHSEFKVGHTRVLHAWSLGACVVAFRATAEAMPEIVHRRNALLASTPDEMAALVAEAAADKALRRSLAHAGEQTLKTQFDPAMITSEIADHLVAIATARRAAAVDAS